MGALITRVERDFILQQLAKSHGNLLLLGPGKNGMSSVHAVTKEFLVLQVLKDTYDTFKSWERIICYGLHAGQRFIFSTKIRKVEGNLFFLGIPDTMYKAPKRRHIRLPPPHDLKMYVTIKNRNLKINFPESSESDDVYLPETVNWKGKNDLRTLVTEFKYKANGLSVVNGIVMYQPGKEPSKIEERLIVHYARALLIPDTKKPLPSQAELADDRLISREMLEAYEGPTIFLDVETLGKSNLKKSDNHVISELYVPIQYFQYTVGYVYLMNDYRLSQPLGINELDFAWEFAHVLSYHLHKSDYFHTGKAEPEHVEPQLIDITPGGCLLSLSKEIYPLLLKKGYCLIITMILPEKKIELTGKIVRGYSDSANFYYGIQFIDIDEELELELSRILYGVETLAQAEEALDV